MPRLLLANNASSKLAAGITSAAVSATLQASGGALFPTPSGGNNFVLTISNADGSALEICLCTARAGDVLTIVRGQEGTTARAWAGGDDVELRVTAAVMAELATKTDTETLTNKTLTAPVINNPTGIVKANVGLGNVDNTSDASKPVSVAQAAADSLVASNAAADATAKANAAAAASTPVAHAGSGGAAHANAVSAGAAGFMTGADKEKLDGITGTNTGDTAANGREFFQSIRDFTNGTLITTNILLANGQPWLLEIKGNSYGGGSGAPYDIIVQGYIYSVTPTVAHSGSAFAKTSSGLNNIYAFGSGGVLCFWFARQSYWQGFDVRCVVANATGYVVNSVVSITDAALPGTRAWEAIFNATPVATGGGTATGTNTGDNAANSNYAADYRAANFIAGTHYLAPNGSAAALTGFPTLNQNTTGSSGSCTGNAATATTATSLSLQDTRAVSDNPFAYFGVSLHFKNTGTDGLSDGGSHYGQLKLTPYSDFSGQNSHQLAFTTNNNVWHRNATGATTWGAWYKLHSTANFVAGTHYQTPLVSGTSIKTVGGVSLLGSGDIPIVGGLVTTSIKTSAYTAVANDLVRLNSTSGAFTVTLPSSPADGIKVGFVDLYNICTANPVLVVAPGGASVEFDVSGLSINISGAFVTLMYNSANTNWKRI